jgi:hypothetical protein
MKYAAVLQRSGPHRTFWDVVDKDAGLNLHAFPNVTIASCREESHAQRICDMMNGEGWAAAARDNIRLQTERDVAQRHMQTWQDKCTALMAERDEARKDCAAIYAQRAQISEDYRALLNKANGDRDARQREAKRARDEIAILKGQRDAHVCVPSPTDDMQKITARLLLEFAAAMYADAPSRSRLQDAIRDMRSVL